MNITVNEELLAYIDPLTEDEKSALERSILAEGCRDALVLWGDVLVDGHNRYAICSKHGITFNTVQSQLFQRGVLALRKKGILAAHNKPPTDAAPVPAPEPKVSREAVAKEARISANTISQIEKIQKTAAPELIAAIKAGAVSINAAATVASLPVEAQVAAVAGGKKELQQAARQVREAKAVERTESETPEGVIARLKQTISQLQSENAALKEKLAALG